jgi:glycosyltransferase involved in cell wall biosynthesis
MARSALRVEIGLDDGTVLVGLVARFDPQKNHQGFVDAAALILRKQPNVKFIMVGHGINWSNATLVDWINKAGIASSVHLLGQRSDMPLVTAALDVAVNSSLGEGFPNAIGEAMACAVPCVVTDVGDSADIVGETGRVVPAGDPVSLAEEIFQILSLSHEERVKLGQAARKRVAERYEIGAVVERYQVFYSLLAEEKI